MKKPRVVGKALSVLVGMMLFWGLQTAEAKSYPEVVYVKGAAKFTTDGVPQARALKAGVVFKKKGTVITEKDGEVKVELDPQRFVIVRGHSNIQFPVVSENQGEVPVLILHKGEIYISQGDSYNMAVRSDLNEFITPKGRYLIGYSPAQGKSWVKVLEGTFVFSALNLEESVTVQSGEQASFQGVIEDGQIAYDVLLKGKKIPKGQLSKVSKIEPADMGLYSPEKMDQVVKDAKVKAEKAAKAIRQEQAKFVCQAPPGKFNDCKWVLEKDGCYRTRCNANGQWAENTLVSIQPSGMQCSKVPHVGSCDY